MYPGLTFLTNLVKLLVPFRINRQASGYLLIVSVYTPIRCVTAQTLIRFYIAKLDDFDSLPSSLEALTVLSKLPTFDDEATVEVYQA